MNDPVGVIIGLITRLFIFIGGLIGEAINTGLMTLLRGWNSGGRENKKTREVTRVQEDEEARQTECRKAVLDFAHGFGYLTREVMSQKEVGELIDSGISGQDLTDEFYKRMGQIPGIFLGQREMTGGGTLDIKLPFSLRVAPLLYHRPLRIGQNKPYPNNDYAGYIFWPGCWGSRAGIGTTYR